MSYFYQKEVGDNIDYNITDSPFGFPVRGPFVDQLEDQSPIPTVAFLGAAQTFGTWCEFPFPTLVSSALSVNSLNLGYGGAGPAFFQETMRLSIE